jgi:hypothetical protein
LLTTDFPNPSTSQKLDGRFFGPAPDTGLPPDPSTLDPDNQALQRLISRTAPRSELASLIETIFPNKKVADIVDRLQDDDAQTFINVIDEV